MTYDWRLKLWQAFLFLLSLTFGPPIFALLGIALWALLSACLWYVGWVGGWVLR